VSEHPIYDADDDADDDADVTDDLHDIGEKPPIDMVNWDHTKLAELEAKIRQDHGRRNKR
jgi:hypothetical protein